MAQTLKAPVLDPDSVPARRGSSYPQAFQAEVEDRGKRQLGEALGLTRYGVNLVTLAPGAWSAQRHWHSHEDEFVYVVTGALTLVTEAGEQLLETGMAAGFPAGVADGHHLVNRSGTPATYIEVGDRSPDDEVTYPDIDLFLPSRNKGRVFTNKQGEPYE